MEFALATSSFLGTQVIPATLFCRQARAVSLTVTASGSYNRSRNDKVYTRLDSCLVIPPPPRFKKPRAIVKFLGGAFVGAVPELTYRYFYPLILRVYRTSHSLDDSGFGCLWKNWTTLMIIALLRMKNAFVIVVRALYKSMDLLNF